MDRALFAWAPEANRTGGLTAASIVVPLHNRRSLLRSRTLTGRETRFAAAFTHTRAGWRDRGREAVHDQVLAWFRTSSYAPIVE